MKNNMDKPKNCDQCEHFHICKTYFMSQTCQEKWEKKK